MVEGRGRRASREGNLAVARSHSQETQTAASAGDPTLHRHLEAVRHPGLEAQQRKDNPENKRRAQIENIDETIHKNNEELFAAGEHAIQDPARRAKLEEQNKKLRAIQMRILEEAIRDYRENHGVARGGAKETMTDEDEAFFEAKMRILEMPDEKLEMQEEPEEKTEQIELRKKEEKTEQIELRKKEEDTVVAKKPVQTVAPPAQPVGAAKEAPNEVKGYKGDFVPLVKSMRAAVLELSDLKHERPRHGEVVPEQFISEENLLAYADAKLDQVMIPLRGIDLQELQQAMQQRDEHVLDLVHAVQTDARMKVITYEENIKDHLFSLTSDDKYLDPDTRLLSQEDQDHLKKMKDVFSGLVYTVQEYEKKEPIIKNHRIPAEDFVSRQYQDKKHGDVFVLLQQISPQMAREVHVNRSGEILEKNFLEIDPAHENVIGKINAEDFHRISKRSGSKKQEVEMRVEETKQNPKNPEEAILNCLMYANLQQHEAKAVAKIANILDAADDSEYRTIGHILQAYVYDHEKTPSDDILALAEQLSKLSNGEIEAPPRQQLEDKKEGGLMEGKPIKSEFPSEREYRKQLFDYFAKLTAKTTLEDGEGGLVGPASDFIQQLSTEDFTYLHFDISGSYTGKQHAAVHEYAQLLINREWIRRNNAGEFKKYVQEKGYMRDIGDPLSEEEVEKMDTAILEQPAQQQEAAPSESRENRTVAMLEHTYPMPENAPEKWLPMLEASSHTITDLAQETSIEEIRAMQEWFAGRVQQVEQEYETAYKSYMEQAKLGGALGRWFDKEKKAAYQRLEKKVDALTLARQQAKKLNTQIAALDIVAESKEEKRKEQEFRAAQTKKVQVESKKEYVHDIESVRTRIASMLELPYFFSLTNEEKHSITHNDELLTSFTANENRRSDRRKTYAEVAQVYLDRHEQKMNQMDVSALRRFISILDGGWQKIHDLGEPKAESAQSASEQIVSLLEGDAYASMSAEEREAITSNDRFVAALENSNAQPAMGRSISDVAKRELRLLKHEDPDSKETKAMEKFMACLEEKTPASKEKKTEAKINQNDVQNTLDALMEIPSIGDHLTFEQQINVLRNEQLLQALVENEQRGEKKEDLETIAKRILLRMEHDRAPEEDTDSLAEFIVAYTEQEKPKKELEHKKPKTKAPPTQSVTMGKPIDEDARRAETQVGILKSLQRKRKKRKPKKSSKKRKKVVNE